MAADGAATLVAFGSVQTVRQPHRKLEIINGQIIVGTAGPVAINQLFRDEIGVANNNGKLIKEKRLEVKKKLRDCLWKHVERETCAANALINIMGRGAVAMNTLSRSLVAMPVEDQPCLLQFNEQACPEEASTSLPFVSIGSAQALADSHLAFLKRVLWKDQPLNVRQGVFAAYWTLTNAIQISPGGISKPIQIVTLERVNSKWKAREQSKEQVTEHEEVIGRAEEKLKTLDPTIGESTPEIPPKLKH